MKVLNRSTGKIISANCQKAVTFFSRLKGLMFSNYHHDLLLVSPIETQQHSSIHMLFMKYPIDVIWINKGMEVVGLKEKIPPLYFLKTRTWKIYRPKKPAKYVLELKAGGIEESESKVGDEVGFIKK